MIRGVFVLLGKKKGEEEEDQRCGEETGRLIIARSKSSGNQSHVTCVGSRLIFSTVRSLFDLLSLSYRNEPYGLSCSNMGMCSAVLLLFSASSVEWWSLWPASAQGSFEGSFTRSAYRSLPLLRHVLMSGVLGLFRLVGTIHQHKSPLTRVKSFSPSTWRCS